MNNSVLSVGDRVETVNPCNPNINAGSKGTVIEFQGRDSMEYITVRFDHNNEEHTWAKRRFKKINESEDKSMLTVGSKVLWDDKSYALEMDNGTLKGVVPKGYRGVDKEIYEITMTAQQLPGSDDYAGRPQTNDTIIRRISDGRVFFVQQRFLQEYVATPKFKRGDWVEYRGQYYRVVLSKVNNGKVSYEMTQFQSTYSKNDERIGCTVTEDEIKEVQ